MKKSQKKKIKVSRPKLKKLAPKKTFKSSATKFKKPSKAELEKQLARRRYFGYSIKNKKTKKKTFVKGISLFVSFKVNRKRITQKQAAKINKYWHHIDRLQARPVTIYKTTSKKNLKIAQEFAGHDPKFKEISVAFVPVTNHDVKVKVTKGAVSVETTHVKTSYITFDHKKLIKDPVKYVRDIVEREHPKAKTFNIRVGYKGIYEIQKGAQKGNIGRRVAYYMSKYDDKTKNNYYQNWLHGLNAYYAKNQANVDAYRAARRGKQKTEAKGRRKIRKVEHNALNVLGFEYGKEGTLKKRKGGKKI